MSNQCHRRARVEVRRRCLWDISKIRGEGKTCIKIDMKYHRSVGPGRGCRGTNTKEEKRTMEATQQTRSQQAFDKRPRRVVRINVVPCVIALQLLLAVKRDCYSFHWCTTTEGRNACSSFAGRPEQAAKSLKKLFSVGLAVRRFITSGRRTSSSNFRSLTFRDRI